MAAHVNSSAVYPTMQAEEPPLSDYFYTLDKAAKKRYGQKISLFRGEDPYKLRKSEFTNTDTYPDFK